MAKFTITKPGSPPVSTDCPEIALMFGKKLMDEQKLRDFLRPHLEVQAAIRALLQQGLGNGLWIVSDLAEAKAVSERIRTLSSRSAELIVGTAKMAYEPKR